MAFVSGNSESVRQLKSVFSMTMDKIEQDIELLDKYKKIVMDGWNDEGASELEEIVTTIKRALSNARESRTNIERALESYAQFLEEK